jgi:hypothetical protein
MINVIVDDDADDDNGESDLSDVDEEDEANKQISKKKQVESCTTIM